jgi:hypothetical protein
MRLAIRCVPCALRHDTGFALGLVYRYRFEDEAEGEAAHSNSTAQRSAAPGLMRFKTAATTEPSALLPFLLMSELRGPQLQSHLLYLSESDRGAADPLLLGARRIFRLIFD